MTSFKHHASHAFSVLLRETTFFVITTVVLRWVELLFIEQSGRIDVPLSLWLTTPLLDGMCYFVIAILLTSVLSLMTFATAEQLRALFRILCVVIFIIHAALTVYFSQTLTLLGSDLWAYSMADIRLTLKNSAGFTYKILILMLLGPALYLGLGFLAGKINRKFSSILLVVTVLIAMCGELTLLAGPDTTLDITSQSLAENKLLHLVTSSIKSKRNETAVIATSTHIESDEIANKEYPFFRAFKPKNVLGPFLNLDTTPPNIVVIQVEGLGACFLDKNGPYGGFTPFLEELSKRSLYWQNFVSTTGRTFGILPGLYGSLPFGKEGFMETGVDMPSHFSVFKWLKKNGYSCQYFYGGDVTFEKQDLFLERSELDYIGGEQKFSRAYKKMATNEGGFSWGYSDKDIFRNYINEHPPVTSIKPRFDVFMTLSIHEPFKVPEIVYKTKFDAIVAGFDVAKRQSLIINRGIFETILYLDDAVKQFIEEYRNLPSFSNTIFIITGDHRVIPLPLLSAIDRFHVPFIIWSPMMSRSGTFKSINSHFDFAPSLMALLGKRYNYTFLDSTSFMGNGLDTSYVFSSMVNLPIMQIKGSVNEYIMGDHYISSGSLYKISDNLKLTPDGNDSIRMLVKNKLNRFIAINAEVSKSGKLYPRLSDKIKEQYLLTAYEKRYLTTLDMDKKSSDEMFEVARDFVFKKDYKNAELIVKAILNKKPSYIDARLLYGRMLCWQNRYAEARRELIECISRNPQYADTYVALSDMYNWMDKTDSARIVVNIGLTQIPDDKDLLEKRKKYKK